MKLSICVISLISRTKLLFELIQSLQLERTKDVELLISQDAGVAPIGAKRNWLVKAARGEYIVHIDDDDTVSPNYIPAVLAAIKRDPFTDVVLIRGRRIENNIESSAVEFDYRIGGVDGEWVGNVLWHNPSHLCPIRADIAKMIPFPEVPRAEDLVWLKRLKPFLHTSQRAGAEGEILYNYRWSSTKRWGT